MIWTPQGLVKYQCGSCRKQFLVGAVDEAENKPNICPFCGDYYVEDWASTDTKEPPDWLDAMG